ncbi:hypothetical protein Cs7R123_53040 [Catellatospora sp. TT07R-123]|uniref:hypothetical protein n=1 Tax=Catellatospora sp. TT07R-123 TaxID=2733863 RepID=UPI001AFFF7D1|nr:hypothetical protein [Catellatospora sp. TT07R-123]GHJ47962.1 hypothetical protein Cs7R123_53040 [Catellatospora sp. TT07R-123]
MISQVAGQSGVSRPRFRPIAGQLGQGCCPRAAGGGRAENADSLPKSAAQCQDDTANLFWCPPFTQIYDPTELNTWTWIANRLGQLP